MSLVVFLMRITFLQHFFLFFLILIFLQGYFLPFFIMLSLEFTIFSFIRPTFFTWHITNPDLINISSIL